MSLPDRANHKKIRYSLTQVSLFFLLILTLVIIAVFSSISSYYNHMLREAYYSSSLESLEDYLQQCLDEYATMQGYLVEEASTNNDYVELNQNAGSMEFYHAKMKIYNTLRRNSIVADHLNGLFVFSPNTREFTCYSEEGIDRCCFHQVRDFLKRYMDDPNPEDISRKWYWIEAAGSSYMVHFAKSEYGIIGAWLSYQELKERVGRELPQGSVISLYNPADSRIDEEQFADFVMEENSSKNYQIYKSGQTQEKYLVTSGRFPGDDRTIVIFIPLSEIDKQLSPVYRRLALVLLLLVATIIMIMLAFKYLVDLPMHSLHGVLVEIQNGVEDPQIPENTTRVVEIEHLNHVLNGMVTDIRNLKINIYEEQLDKAALEIQMLKAQISPHFLINCLNTFGSLASAPVVNRDQIQHLIYTLTQYIRYSFLRKDTVTVAREFEEVSNYMELVDMRYPDCLTYRLALFPDCKEYEIPPMLLLTLCENTIKHNMIMGEQMVIRLRAQREADMLHLSYVDSGSGYTEEVLEINNHILEHLDRCMDGHHVGIYYIVRSLQLIYGEKARVAFSNEPDMGARTDIYLPIRGEKAT